MNFDIENIKIEIKLTNDEKMKAMVSLDFGDFKVKGFRVMTSKFENERGDELWVVPPSYIGKDKKYHPMFFAENKVYWKKLEQKIIEEFRKKHISELNS